MKLSLHNNFSFKLFFEKYNWLIRLLLLAIVVLVIVNTSQKMIKSQFAKGDMEAYVHAANLILKSENIYATPSRDMAQGGAYYLYLPLLAILFVPLALLPQNVGIVLWTTLNALLIFWIVKTFYETISGERFWNLSLVQQWFIGFFPILFTLRFILHHLSYGQANIIVLACLVAGLKQLKNKQNITGGFSIGIALVLKIIAVPFVFWMLAKAKTKAILGVALGLLFGAILFPSLFLGISRNWEYVSFWISNVILNESLSVDRVPLGVNISLQAELQRFFTETPAFDYAGKSYSLTIYPLSLSTIQILAKLIQGALVGSIFFYAFRFRKFSEIVSEWGGAALVFALIPLFAPTTQKHYFVMLLPSYVYVFYVWHFLKVKDWWFRALVIASFVLATLTVDGVVGRVLDDVFTASGCIAWGTLLLVLAIFRAGICLSKSLDGQLVLQPSVVVN